jgi:hypothetical protein
VHPGREGWALVAVASLVPLGLGVVGRRIARPPARPSPS